MADAAPSVPSSLSLGRHGMTTTAQANRGANGRGGFRPPPRLVSCASPGLETEGCRDQERDRISLQAQEMAADATRRTGGGLCRPRHSRNYRFMTNRGVSDPPLSAATPFRRRPQRVAHAPIPCPVVAVIRGPVRDRLSVYRGCPPDASSHAGANSRMSGRDTKPSVFGRNEPWL